MTVDPQIQRAHDRVAAEYAARREAVAAALRARLRESAERQRPAAEPVVARLEPNDLSARAADYAEEADDEEPPPPLPVARPVDEEDDVPAFRWDEV